MTELFPWQATSQNYLLQLIASDRLPHAMLFSGTHGIGKGRLVEWLAHRLLCHQPTSQGACGVCRSCLLLKAGSHPDLIQIESDKASIGVDLIRQAITSLSETAHQQGARVVIIEHAQNMTESASNALLKTLEEPGRQSFLLLTSPSASQLMATITSRCQNYVVPVPDENIALEWLQQQGSDATEAHLRLNCGAPLVTQKFVSDGNHLRLDAFLVRMLGVLKGQVPAQELVDEAVADSPESFAWLCALLLDVQKVMAGASKDYLVFANHWTELQGVAAMYDHQCPDWAPWLSRWQLALSGRGLNLSMQWQAMLSELSLQLGAESALTLSGKLP
ncbi:DNA polymerase III subunit delta' [Echinimonas agarilytica]|uniref:DNA-directed DNA polymerase n=1 Tax=Echinimonas agarilytica TaxID=1215918 RepID=A0AA41W6Y2_9GAMM|nr:DNA polymerase III subunit delta' [Echinimonas agarilytica]MCM2679862.1 DNA polymerase III subunit delta' [Echinimonas agarilytica]